MKSCPIFFSIFHHLAWHFPVIFSFAFKPVPFFLPPLCQKIRPALLRVTHILNIPWPERAIASIAPWLEQVGFKAHTVVKKITPLLHGLLFTWNGGNLGGECEPELLRCGQRLFTVGSAMLPFTSDLKVLTATNARLFICVSLSFSFPVVNILVKVLCKAVPDLSSTLGTWNNARN